MQKFSYCRSSVRAENLDPEIVVSDPEPVSDPNLSRILGKVTPYTGVYFVHLITIVTWYTKTIITAGVLSDSAT